MKNSLRVATICGVVPLLLGVGIFVVWVFLRQAWLTIAGFMMLYVGLAAVSVGGIALFRYWWLAGRDSGTPRDGRRASVLRCAGLLLANFPVAAAIVAAAFAIETRYTVAVRNTSPDRLDDARVSGGGCDASFGSIHPGVTARRSFWIRRESALVFRASSSGQTLDETIDPYTHGGGHLTVTVDRERKVSFVGRIAHELPLLERLRDVLFWLDRVPCAGDASIGDTPSL